MTYVRPDDEKLPSVWWEERNFARPAGQFMRQRVEERETGSENERVNKLSSW